MSVDIDETEHDDEPLPASGYRTYEVYQRERVGETTNLIRPRQLISEAFVLDPYPLLEILREYDLEASRLREDTPTGPGGLYVAVGALRSGFELQDLLAAGTIRKEGEKRGTKYFPAKGGGARPVAKKPARRSNSSNLFLLSCM